LNIASLLSRTGWPLWACFNLLFALLLIGGAAAGGGSLAELPYVVCLFAICSSAVPFVRRLNDPYAILAVIGAVYFVGFGITDAMGMFTPGLLPRPEQSLMDAGEAVVLAGMGCQFMGFHLGMRLSRRPSEAQPPKDWATGLLLPSGLGIWAAGAGTTLYQSLIVQSDNSAAAVASGFAKLGVWNTTGLIAMENYAGPLGLVILGYWWARHPRRGATALIIAVILIQFCVGWVIDRKESALNAPLVLLLTRLLVQGVIPMRWIAASILGVILVFPILTAKRIIMTEGLGLTRAQALSHTTEILARAFVERNTARSSNKYEQKTQSFIERANDKAAVEVLVAHAGVDHPFRAGDTFEGMLYTFVPRVVWSDKPGENSSVTFNREFNFSADRDTHISPTHLGELYWNFGLPGVLFGMTCIGGLLGFISAKFDPSRHTSMTGILVLIVTLYELVARFEGQIELEYVVWIRTLALIGILHLLFARRGRLTLPAVAATARPSSTDVMHFPNLLR
jgi:hypothetical protein